LKNYPSFSRAVIERLAFRIQYLLDQIEDISLHTVEERLARFLLAQSEEDVWERETWITHTEIAARLGTVLDVVNRNLQKFVRDGLIEIQRNKILIIDRARLEKIAQG
jgi:CRP-like cAMP-binding protein